MNPLHPDSASSDDAIETAAAEWLCERDERFAPGRAEAFAAWRAVDPRHDTLSDLVQRMRRTQQTSEYIQHMGPFFVGYAVWRKA